MIHIDQQWHCIQTRIQAWKVHSYRKVASGAPLLSVCQSRRRNIAISSHAAGKMITENAVTEYCVTNPIDQVLARADATSDWSFFWSSLAGSSLFCHNSHRVILIRYHCQENHTILKWEVLIDWMSWSGTCCLPVARWILEHCTFGSLATMWSSETVCSSSSRCYPHLLLSCFQFDNLPMCGDHQASFLTIATLICFLSIRSRRCSASR